MRDAPRILMLLENGPYPADIRVRLEAQALTEAGYRVTVIGPREAGQAWHEPLDGVSVYRYPAALGANSFLGYVWEYGYALSATFGLSLWVWLRHGFDILHAHNPPDLFCLIAAFYKLLAGKRFVYDHHDLAPEMYTVRFEHGGNRWVHRALCGLEWLSHRLADHVIVVNESYKRMAMTRGQVPEHRLTVVRNGPDLALLNADIGQHHAQLAPRRAEGQVVLAYVGVMGYQDGLDYLLRALHHLVRDLGRSDFCCVLIGQGDAYAELQSTADALALNDYVIFTGWVNYDQVGSYLQAADICVAPEPSNTYTDLSTTIKMMEYMALGKPIVAFELPEHQWSARDSALYARPNDELDFARCIAVLMDDPQRRQRMGAYGRHRIETELAWPYQAQHLIAAYEALRAASQRASETPSTPAIR